MLYILLPRGTGFLPMLHCIGCSQEAQGFYQCWLLYVHVQEKKVIIYRLIFFYFPEIVNLVHDLNNIIFFSFSSSLALKKSKNAFPQSQALKMFFKVTNFWVSVQSKFLRPSNKYVYCIASQNLTSQ